SHGQGIFRLVIIGGKWKRNQNSGAAGRFDFCNRRGAGARYDEIRSRILLMKIIEEGAHVGFETFARIRAAHFFELPLAGLVYEAKTVLPVREVIEGFHDGAINGLRALASSENQNRVRRRVQL